VRLRGRSTTIRWKQYFPLGSGSVPVISGSNLKKQIVSLPTFSDQTAIASLLSTWDLAIEKAERLIVAKEKRFTSLVMSMIADKCDRWAHLRADKIFKSISEKQNDHEELLSVTQDRGVIPRTMLEGRVMSPESGTDTYKLIKVGDFAISLRSFQGGIEYSRYQGLISPAYTVLRSKLEIDDDFYRHFFKSYLFIGKYLSIAVIGIRDGKQISIPDFMTVKIPLPPIEEQKQIAATLTTARQEIDLLKKQAVAYRRQKRGLMQRLLTGEWRVRVG
jgi:type I restriction enzyme, S subunit